MRRVVSTAVQPAAVFAGLRTHLLQQGGDDLRSRRGNRGRHDRGQDRAHHRRSASRALPVSACPAPLHPEEGWEAAAVRSAIVVGQAARRSDPPVVRGVLRAAVLRALPRLPARPGLPHRPGRGGENLDRDQLVYRGRHLPVLRPARSSGHARHAGREDPRQPDASADRPDAASWVPGGLGVERHAQRRAAGRGSLPVPVQHLPGSAGQVRRHNAVAGIQPRGAQETQS